MKNLNEYVSSNDKYSDENMTLVDGEDSVSVSAQCAEILNIFLRLSSVVALLIHVINAESLVPYRMENFKISEEVLKPEFLDLYTKKILRTG